MPPKRRLANLSGDADTGPLKQAKRTKFAIEHASTIVDTSKNGVVLVTGAGDVGQLGLGSDVLEKSRFALVPLGDWRIVDVCAGGMHTVCLTDTGEVLTFGCNDEGALGRVTTDQEDAEFTAGEVKLPLPAVQISAGDSHTAALLNDGRVFVWGTFRDSHGNMGLTPKGNEKLPYEIMKDRIIVKIASGADHVVFLTTLGEIYTCGCGEQGQLGRVSERSSDRNARSGAGVDQLGKLLHPARISLKPSLRLHFDDIWTGTYATYAKVANKDTVYVFGLNNYNQIGLKKTVPHFMPTLSQDFTSHSWHSICGGQHHSLALDRDGKVYTIGRKEYGRLGLGDSSDDAVVLTQVEGLDDKQISEVCCGSATSFAVTTDGQLYGWGMATVGQLGTGADEDCYEPTLIKSRQLTDRKVLKASSGGQHTVILATNLTEKTDETTNSVKENGSS